MWSDIAHAYLLALLKSGISTRVLPIGGAMPSLRQKAWRHWTRVRDAFAGELAPNCVNVVCCPAGQLTGRRITGRSLAPTRVVSITGGEVPPMILAAGAGADDQVVYEPELALVGLLTAGKRNIAITGAVPITPCDAEVEALKQYHAVITPTEDCAAALRLLGIDAHQYSAGALQLEATSLPIFLGVE